MPERFSAWRWAGMAVFFAAATVLYLPSLTVLPFGDDWEMLAWAEKYGSEIFYKEHNFRVWQRLLFAWAFPRLGDGILPLTIGLSITVFLLSAGFVAWLAWRVAPALTLAPLAAVALYLFHPANVSAIVQIDTFSQNLADFLALVLVYQAVFSSNLATARSAAVTAVLALVVLCAKETALGILAWIPIAGYLRGRFIRGITTRVALKNFLVMAVAVAAGLAIYLWIRTAAGTPLAPAQAGRYSMHFDPANALLNAAQLWGAAVYYGDAATLFVFGPSLKVAVSIVLSALLLVIAVVALASDVPGAAAGRDPIRGQVLLWGSFAGAAVVPAILLGSVSELYSAGVVPFVALVLGISCAHLHQASPRPIAGPFIALLLLAIAGWGAVSVSDKLSMHRQVSERTWQFVRAVRPLVAQCPAPGKMVSGGNLADTTSGGRPYSIFSHTNERAMRNALLAVTHPQLAGWLSRTAWTALPENGQMAHCEIGTSAAGSCELRCLAAPTSQSKFMTCRLLKERCADTRR